MVRRHFSDNRGKHQHDTSTFDSFREACCTTLFLHNDVLCHVDGLSTPGKVVRHQLCIPKSLRERITEEAHAFGHVGITKLLGVLRRRFYWPYMSKTVKAVVRRCGPCAEHKARRFRKLCLRKPIWSKTDHGITCTLTYGSLARCQQRDISTYSQLSTDSPTGRK